MPPGHCCTGWLQPGRGPHPGNGWKRSGSSSSSSRQRDLFVRPLVGERVGQWVGSVGLVMQWAGFARPCPLCSWVGGLPVVVVGWDVTAAWMLGCWEVELQPTREDGVAAKPPPSSTLECSTDPRGWFQHGTGRPLAVLPSRRWRREEGESDDQNEGSSRNVTRLGLVEYAGGGKGRRG